MGRRNNDQAKNRNRNSGILEEAVHVALDNNDNDAAPACCRCCGPRCIWLPYDDYWMQSAQFLAVLCVFLSWVWWVTFLASILGNIPIQMVWCRRQSRGAMLVAASTALVCGLVSIGSGIYVGVVWSAHDRCQPFFPKLWSCDDDDPFYDSAWKHADHCVEALWATIPSVAGVLWFAASGCIFWFVGSGRHEAWEVQLAGGGSGVGVGDHNSTNNENNYKNKKHRSMGSITTKTQSVHSRTTVGDSAAVPSAVSVPQEQPSTTKIGRTKKKRAKKNKKAPEYDPEAAKIVDPWSDCCA